MFSSFEANEYLTKLQMFGIKLGLEQTRELFDAVGAPDKQLRFIHLAGSNGKGSCGAMLNAALRKAGFKTGFYSSPHLVSPRERLRVNGNAISEEDFADLIWRVSRKADEMAEAGRCPTYFEFTTTMAALYFAEQKCDFVIWETGMGGRFDATNVVAPECSVITGIALDHQAYLGDSIEKIAFEKAGIIKSGRPVFAGIMPDEALAVVKARAGEEQAVLNLPAQDELKDFYTEMTPEAIIQGFKFKGYDIRLSLVGKMQRRNFRTVFPVLEYLSGKFGFELDQALAGLSEVRWPARCQRLQDGTIIDGGHNPDGVKNLVDSLKELLEQPVPVIFGSFKDKDTVQCLKELIPIAERFIFLPISTDFRPSYSGEELCEILKSISDITAIPAGNVNEALSKTQGEKTRLVAGSLFLAGDFLKKLCTESDILNI
jgi:dihydrofolate synthase/folylpolyglutamate synthase